MDIATVAPIASGIGAAGAVAGQVAAAIFTGRRESKKLEWEKQQAAERQRLERQRLFADTKREVYARFLSMATQRQQLLLNAPESLDPVLKTGLSVMGDNWRGEATEVLAEIQLFSKKVAMETMRFMVFMIAWQAWLNKDESDPHADLRAKRIKEFRSDDRIFEGLREAMREDLGIEVLPLPTELRP